MEDSGSVLFEEIRACLSILNSDEALGLLTPSILDELQRAVCKAGRLVKLVHTIPEVLDACKPECEASSEPVTDSRLLADSA